MAISRNLKIELKYFLMYYDCKRQKSIFWHPQNYTDFTDLYAGLVKSPLIQPRLAFDCVRVCLYVYSGCTLWTSNVIRSRSRSNEYNFIIHITQLHDPAGTSVISALFEGVYNGGLWEKIFLSIHNWSIYLTKNNFAQLYFILQRAELRWTFSSWLRDAPDIYRSSVVKICEYQGYP